MKRWQRALGDLRVVLPDTPKYNGDVKYLYWYIGELEAALKEVEAWPHKIHKANDITYLPHHIHQIAHTALNEGVE